MITRTVTRDQLARWGIPFGGNTPDQAQVLDIVPQGREGFADYNEMIFVAPDDNKAYSVDYARGLAISDPFAGQPEEITLTWVRSEKRQVVVTDWKPMTQEYVDGQETKVPTLAQLKARWAANRADDVAAAEDATW